MIETTTMADVKKKPKISSSVKSTLLNVLGIGFVVAGITVVSSYFNALKQVSLNANVSDSANGFMVVLESVNVYSYIAGVILFMLLAAVMFIFGNGNWLPFASGLGILLISVAVGLSAIMATFSYNGNALSENIAETYSMQSVETTKNNVVKVFNSDENSVYTFKIDVVEKSDDVNTLALTSTVP